MSVPNKIPNLIDYLMNMAALLNRAPPHSLTGKAHAKFTPSHLPPNVSTPAAATGSSKSTTPLQSVDCGCGEGEAGPFYGEGRVCQGAGFAGLEN